MSKIELSCNGTKLEVEVRRVIAAGYTGRDADQVRRHIEELKRHGVPAPETFPVFFNIAPEWLTTAGDLGSVVATASGEAEPVLLFPSDTFEDAVVAVGSDLTDRNLERESVERSKQIAKPISREIWRYKDVAKCWNEIQLRSWTDAPEQPYQAGTLANLREPRDLVAKLTAAQAGRLSGTVLFMGTIPLNVEGFRFAPFFGCELIRPDGPPLRLEYRVTLRG